MATRTVFKCAGSFGPGGAIVTLTEKICRAVFYDAYEQGDPTRESIQIYEDKAQQQRSDYVSELFQHRGRLEREMESMKEEVRTNAYKELGELIKKHIAIVSKTEKNRLLRLRLRLKDNANEYRKVLEQAKRVD